MTIQNNEKNLRVREVQALERIAEVLDKLVTPVDYTPKVEGAAEFHLDSDDSYPPIYSEHGAERVEVEHEPILRPEDRFQIQDGRPEPMGPNDL